MNTNQLIASQIVEINNSLKEINNAILLTQSNSFEIFTVFVSIFTVGLLLWTAIETRRMAIQAVESNTRPKILRTGQIVKWQVVSKTQMTEGILPTLEFTNVKNIAVDITGHIVLDNKSYELLFYSNVRGSQIIQDGKPTTLVFNKKWGWLPENSSIIATYDEASFSTTTSKNGWYLSYQDIDGIPYFSSEDSNFSQVSRRRIN